MSGHNQRNGWTYIVEDKIVAALVDVLLQQVDQIILLVLLPMRNDHFEELFSREVAFGVVVVGAVNDS